MAQKKTQNKKDAEVVALENKVSAAKKNVTSLKKDLESTKAEYDKTVAKHAKRVNALKNSKAKIKDDILLENSKIEKDLVALAKKQEQFQAEHDADQKLITTKIEELKQKRKELLLSENDKENKTFLKKKNDIEKKLSSLRTTKAKQAEAFDQKMSELKNTYDQLLNEKKNEITIVKEKLEAENEKALKKAKELQEAKEEQERLEKEALEKQRLEQEERIAKLNKEKEKTINGLNATLNDLDKEFNSLKSLKETLEGKLESFKVSSENEYNELNLFYENEHTRLINEYNLKYAELTDAQNKLDSDIKRHRQDYENRTKEIETVAALLEERKNSKKQSVVKALEDLDASLKAKHSDYLDYLDQQLETEKKNRETELKTLEYNLEQEEIQLRNRNSYLDSRFAKREEEFKNNLEENARQLNDLNNTLVEEEHAHAARKNELENALAKMKDNHYLSIETKNKENLKAYQDRKNELSDKENKLVSLISSLRTDISTEIGLIEDIKKEIESKTAEFERNKANLASKQETMVNDSNLRKAYLEELSASVKTKTEEENAKFVSQMKELDEVETNKRAEYDNAIALIDEEFVNKKNVLEVKSEEDIKQLNAQHENAIADIVSKYNANVLYVESLYNSKREEYERERVSIDEYANKLNEETANKLAEFESQRNTILESMEALKAEKLQDDKDYSDEVASIEVLYKRQLEEAENAHRERMANLQKEYEEKNLEGIFEELSAQLSSRKLENENLEVELDRKARQFVIDIDTLNTEFELKKQGLLAEQKHQEELYEQLVEAAEKSENDARNALDQKRANIRDYQSEIAEKIEAIRAQKQADYDNYVALSNEKLQNEQNRLEEKRLNTQNSYDAKIDTIRKQFDLKMEQYNALLESIAAKKEAFVNEQKNKYNQEIDYTNMMQERMNETIENNAQYRNSLIAKLDEKREEIARNLEDKRNQLTEVFNEKTQTYEDYMNTMYGKFDELKYEIEDLENAARIKAEEFETYAVNKKQEINDLKDSNRNYLEELKNTITDLENRRDEAEAIHQSRIYETKKQIAAAMSEYDDLLRNAPATIEEETASAAELEDATREFKSKLDEMNSQYEAIISELEEEKLEVLRSIAKDIDSLGTEAHLRKEEHNAQIKEIYDTYSRMIEEEKNKQASIDAQVETIREQHEYEIKQIEDQSNALPTEYEAKVTELMGEFNSRMKDYSNKFKESSEKLKADFDKMSETRALLNKRISSIAAAYAGLDSQVEQGKTNLQIITRKLMNDILVNAERKSKNKLKLNNLDAMSNEDN